MDDVTAAAGVTLEASTPRARKRDWRSLLLRIVKQGVIYLLLVAATYGFFRFSHRYLLQTVRVEGSSMAPTLMDADCYVLNSLVYVFRDPEPMDIVALRDPADDGLAVKRIVAKPGDSVYLEDGQLFVNGRLLSEPYLTVATKTYGSPKYRAQMWICGMDQYFVLGDNRENSADSREYGPVLRANILGMIVRHDGGTGQPVPAMQARAKRDR